jgi:hypothetical protein
MLAELTAFASNMLSTAMATGADGFVFKSQRRTDPSLAPVEFAPYVSGSVQKGQVLCERCWRPYSRLDFEPAFRERL